MKRRWLALYTTLCLLFGISGLAASSLACPALVAEKAKAHSCCDPHPSSDDTQVRADSACCHLTPTSDPPDHPATVVAPQMQPAVPSTPLARALPQLVEAVAAVADYTPASPRAPPVVCSSPRAPPFFS